MNRRRFLALAACAGLAGRSAPPPPLVWRGTALGAAASIALRAHDPAQAQAALAAALAAIRAQERLFSLRDPDSALSRLNAEGVLAAPPPDFAALAAFARDAAAATGGVFDPTVQPLWTALAAGDDPAPSRRLIGWRGLALSPAGARFLRLGMAATFNGVAQGWAADRARAALAAHGFRDALANVGEFSGAGFRPDGRPWRVGVAHPATGALIATLDAASRGVATSAPGATRVGPAGAPHIFDPLGAPGPRLAQVTVAAETAALADALSTAAAAAPAAEAPALLAAGGAEEAVLVAADGGATRLRF